MNGSGENTQRNWLRLDFEVIRPITRLEYFQGVYWSAMLRDWLRPYFDRELSELGIYPVPGQNGFRDLYPGETVCLELSVPRQHLARVVDMLEDELGGIARAVFPDPRLHFLPGASLKLISYANLPDGEGLEPASPESCAAEAAELAGAASLDLVFYCPLRLKPGGESKGDFRFLDPLGLETEVFWQAFCRELEITPGDAELPKITGRGLIWLDVPYSKTLGGLLGGVTLAGPVPQLLLAALLWGQYRGIGKNRGLGFGFFTVGGSRLDRARKANPRRASFLARAASLGNLRSTLEEMNSGSPGPDNLAREDLLEAGKPYLLNARKMLLKGSLSPGETLSFYKRSSSGKYRVISISNIHERHLLLALLRQIELPLDRLIGKECYSYRRGKSYHQAAEQARKYFSAGFAKGLKSDISSFFDSIPRQSLRLLLEGLFGADPTACLISSYMLGSGLGIPQGNPLSPLLSNLYLIPFDRELGRQGWHLVRYADDFCLFANHPHDLFLDAEAVEGILAKLGLKLSRDKTLSFTVKDSLDFLGYRVGREDFGKLKQPRDPELESHGIPAFQDDFARGRPLYLTFRETHVTSEGNCIALQTGDGIRRHSWKEISRIVVIGKPRVSAGVIQQALIRKKPVVFMTVMGRQLGGFAHNSRSYAPAQVFNSPDMSWQDFQLDYIRSLVAAKIHNQRTLLQSKGISEPRLRELEASLTECADPEVLRGKEGAASVVYWRHFRELVKPLDFPRRSYHPPEGPVNAMLSLGYTILYFRMAESLSAAMLNPWEGIFHSPRGLHYALASDMIEPYRFLVDRVVLSLIHNRQIGPDDFISEQEGSAPRLSSAAMKSYIHRYELTMRNEVKIGDLTLSWALQIDRAPFQLMRSLRLGLPFKPFRMC
jgi:CRISPR-associated endonuclease Cas1